MYIEVPIIGTGTRRDGYRPKCDSSYSAVIPSDSLGHPKRDKCIIAIDDDVQVPKDSKQLADAEAIDNILIEMPTARIDKVKTSKSRISPVLITPLLGFMAASKSPVDRRWMMKAGLYVAGGYVFTKLMQPRPAYALTRNTLGSDSFTRADNADLGAAWDPYTGADNAKIESNSAKCATVSNFVGQEAYNTTIPANDQWASVDISRLSNGLAYVNAGVLCRYAAPSTYTGYLAAVQLNDVFIGKMVAGTFTSLASVSYTVTPATFTPSLEVSGTGLECFIDLASKVSTTDASVASGRTGISWYIDSGGSYNDVNMLNFAMGDFTSGARPSFLQMLGVS